MPDTASPTPDFTAPNDDSDLFALVYDELRGLAGALIRDQRPGHTLQPTALVNEAYVKLLQQTRIRADSRSQFFCLAARVMRQVLVDHARGKGRKKRGGGRHRRVEMDASAVSDTPSPVDQMDVLAVDDALSELSKLDVRRARLVELRVFGGLSLDEAADTLGIARSTAALDWRFAKAWLAKRLGEARTAIRNAEG